MKHILMVAALLSSTAVYAQDTNVSGSASDANAISGSQSGAQSNNHNVNDGGNNAGIGNSVSGSASDATAISSTTSGSQSNGNQQGQSANNTQGQGQDQGQGQTQTSTGGSSDQGQSQSASNTASQGNQQGVTVNQAWNSTQLKHTRQEFRTNAAVPLAASSSFSSDYCGGTASGGVSAAPIGISIGGAGPTFDKSCQSLRRAEKFGMIAANYHNLGQDDMAGRAMSMMVWSVCTADSRGTKQDYETVQACMEAGLMGQGAQPAQSVYVAPQPEVTPEYTQTPTVQPLPERYHTPRGEMDPHVAPGTPAQPAMAAAIR